ncbi:MAG: formylglycine-generating enzyme family protein [Alphaproteobacteria bacterium]|nr:MAG: formylglycine-generating enzyme family protein [Alphaproteobacteria bacterium]
MGAGGCCAPARDGRGGNGRALPAPGGRPEGVVWLPGGSGFVGTDRPFLPQDGEGPRRPVRLAPFGIERAAVTNRRFAAFVAATGYVTEAEEIGWSYVFRGFLPPELAASAPPSTEAPWWAGVTGASWRHPEGPGSDLSGREDHPVVHVSWRDARSFAAWVGGRLPTEAEWEHAALGGGDGPFPWGSREPDDSGFFPCNIWQGRFPDHDLGRDGYRGTAPAVSFPPNGYGLYNMAGNVWEWCADAFRIRSVSRAARARNALARAGGWRTLKGGSHLCHRSYCYRYRIAARMGLPPDSATGHLGFRVTYDAPPGQVAGQPGAG